MGVKTWTKKQLRIMERLWPVIDDTRKLEEIIGKPFGAIKAKASALKLLRQVPSSNCGRTTATASDDRYLKKAYLSTPVNGMAVHLGRSETFVKTRLRQLNLVQPRELIERFKLMGRIQPGNVPKNKGKKQHEFLSPEAIERTKATRFKKGQKIYNEGKNGEIRLRYAHKDRGERPYYYIRIKKKRWIPLHVHLWRKHKGRIPRGMIVVFKDKNSLNCTIDNLELITKKENMLRNSASKNLSDGYVANAIAWRNKELATEVLKRPDLIELKRTQLILKRTIYEQQQQGVS